MSAPSFTQMIDLAQERLGGRIVEVSDEFFAPAENLLKPGRGIFIEGKYTENGKWMDGWESRRKRTPGHDWCVLQLGLRGVISGVDIDTNHFLGNHPPFASLEAATQKSGDWVEILPKSPLEPGSHGFFEIEDEREWTFLRLNIFPDGGVARLKVYGRVAPDWEKLKGEVDLVAVENGGQVISCNDMFFSSKDNLIMPGRGVNMGDGWETKRKRGPGHDWVVLKAAKPGVVKKIEVDTCHFKGNFPDRCSIEGCLLGEGGDLEAAPWQEIIPETKLEADKQHFFKNVKNGDQGFDHFRMNIFPDGGISRLRIFGEFL